MSINQINSDSLLIDIEQHFKVLAGPGAGKTRWLVNHIKNVLHRSTRLGKSRKIVCITYTNIAANIILERLGESVSHIEVSTIHSFLYRHVVKPYAKFAPKEYYLNAHQLDGHDDRIISNYSFLNDLKKRTKQQRIHTKNNKELVQALESARWKFDTSEHLIVKTDYPHKINGYPIRNDTYLEYKKMSWEKGFLHHDDVLFFSFILIKKYPFILQILRAKFPYFFVDEFQDTNPIQTKILEKIAKEETIVGIIGDKAQSIYGFQGADPSQLEKFNPKDVQEYQIKENYRSTNEIISFLNSIRLDLQQKNSHQNKTGDKPVLIVGAMDASFHKAQELCHNQEIHSLAWRNSTLTLFRKKTEIDYPSKDVLSEYLEVDLTHERTQIILHYMKSIELARRQDFKGALKEISKFNKDSEAFKEKRSSLRNLIMILDELKKTQEASLLDFYNVLKTSIQSKIPGIKKLETQDFYEQHKYSHLATCIIKEKEDISICTIHKAKGNEFDNVFFMPECKKNTDKDEESNRPLAKVRQHTLKYDYK